MSQAQKLLFVCSQNRLRSLTAEHMYQGFLDYAVKSAGTSPKARIRVKLEITEKTEAGVRSGEGQPNLHSVIVQLVPGDLPAVSGVS